MAPLYLNLKGIRMKKIVLIILLMLFLTTMSIAKYYEMVEITSDNKIGEPIIEIEHGEKIVINEIIDKEIDYYFLIKNYKENTTNNINLIYRIIIESNLDDDKVEYYLIDENNKTIELNNNMTEYKELYKEKTKHKYKLHLKFGEELLLNGKINIKIEVTQIEK